jgi:hypothetical protein
MTAIGVIETTVSSTVTSTLFSQFAEVAESSALTNGTTYYVICHALVEGDANGKVFQWRLVDRTNSDAVLSNSTCKREPARTDESQSYYFVGRFTAGSDGGGLAFEQQPDTEGFAASTQYLSMLLLDLSNMDATDFFYANNTTSATHTDSFVNRATVRAISPTAGDTYLMFGWVATDTNTVAKQAEMRMQVTASGETTLTAPTVSYEGEDLTEVLNWWTCRPYTISANDTTFTIQTRDDTSGTQNTYLESTILGFRLNAFENFASTYTDAETTTTSNDWQQLATHSFTPDRTGDIIVAGCSIFQGDANYARSFERVQVGGITIPNAQVDTNYSAIQNDATDKLALSYIAQGDGTAATALTIDMDVKKNVTTDTGWQEYSLSVFTANLTPVSQNFNAVALQTYASGDVASETHASGDVASETYNSGDVASEVNPS